MIYFKAQRMADAGIPLPNNWYRISYFHCSLFGYFLGLLTATISSEVCKIPMYHFQLKYLYYLVHAIYISSFYFKFLSLSRFLKQLSQHCYTWCHSPYFPYLGWLIWREIWRQCGMSLLRYKNNPSKKRNSLQYRMGMHLIILWIRNTICTIQSQNT